MYSTMFDDLTFFGLTFVTRYPWDCLDSDRYIQLCELFKKNV